MCSHESIKPSTEQPFPVQERGSLLTRLDNGYSEAINQLINFREEDMAEAVKNLNLAYDLARMSKDPSTQTGSILVHMEDETMRGGGFNHLPEGMDEAILHTPEKYPNIIHAEDDSIQKYAEEHGEDTLPSCVMVAPWFACRDCAEAIVKAGIKLVVGHKQIFEFADEVYKKREDWSERWNDSIHDAFDLFEKHGVKYAVFDIEMDLAEPIRVGGELFYGKLNKETT